VPSKTAGTRQHHCISDIRDDSLSTLTDRQVTSIVCHPHYTPVTCHLSPAASASFTTTPSLSLCFLS